MAACVARDQFTVQQRALILLSVAESVKREGWGDAVAVELRRAAHDLLMIAGDETGPLFSDVVAELPGPW